MAKTWNSEKKRPVAVLAAAVVTCLINFGAPPAARGEEPPTVAGALNVAVPTQQITDKPARFTSSEALAARSINAQDTKGIEPSLYRGVWYTKKGEPFRLCVISRESHGNYKAQNQTSSARGAYQFLDISWRISLTKMMRSEAKSNNLLPQLDALKKKPISSWNRYWQDAAFFTAYRRGDGAFHWHLDGSYCNKLAG